MAKNSTLSSNAPFISLSAENVKGYSITAEQCSPSEAVIANILAFSQALRIEKSRQTGLIEIVLN